MSETPVLLHDILPLALFGGKRLDTIDFQRRFFLKSLAQYCYGSDRNVTTLHAVQGTPSIRRQLGLKPEQGTFAAG